MSEVVAFRRFPISSESYTSKIHGPSSGQDVFPQDPIKATIRTENGKNTGLLPVYRISPLGIQIDISPLDRVSWRDNLVPGSKLDLNVHIGINSYPFSGVVVLEQSLE